MNIKLVNIKNVNEENLIKCNKLSNDMLFMKYDVCIGDVIEVCEDEFIVLINKGEVYDVKNACGYYKIMNEIIDSDMDIKEEWKDLHIRKTENDDMCIVFLNERVIENNKYLISNPIKYIDFSNNDPIEIFISLEGKYDFKIENPKMFLSKVIGLRHHYSKQELIEKIRMYVLKSIEKGINEISEEYKLSIDDLPENSKKLEIKLKQNEYDAKLLEYGVKLTYFDINRLEVKDKKLKIF